MLEFFLKYFRSLMRPDKRNSDVIEGLEKRFPGDRKTVAAFLIGATESRCLNIEERVYLSEELK